MLPVIGIVLLLCFTVAPVPPGILLAFLAGAVLLMAGMVLFSMGVDMSMSLMGERVGTCMARSKKLWVVAALSFTLGFIITISEPDLQVLTGGFSGGCLRFRRCDHRPHDGAVYYGPGNRRVLSAK